MIADFLPSRSQFVSCQTVAAGAASRSWSLHKRQFHGCFLFVFSLSSHSLPFYSLTTVIYCSMHARNKTNYSLNPTDVHLSRITANGRRPGSERNRSTMTLLLLLLPAALIERSASLSVGERGKRERRTSRNTPTTPTRRSYSLRCLAATTAVSPSMSRLCKIFIARHAEQLSVPIGHVLPSLPPSHARQLAGEDTRRRAQSRRLPCAPS